jgi:hypothetical protein
MEPPIVRIDPDRLDGADAHDAVAARRRAQGDPRRRRRGASGRGGSRLRRTVGALGALAALVLLASAGARVLDTQVDDAAPMRVPAAAADLTEPDTAPVGAEVAGPTGPTVLATVDGIELMVPVAEPILIGFHEASTVEAFELVPGGWLSVDRNHDRARPDDDRDGWPYVVLATRGRPFVSTSSVDIVVPEDAPIVAPVSGTVTDVRTYYLYGRHEDVRIEIVPTDAPHLRVVLIHVGDVRVAMGDQVEAGTTVLAGWGRRFPFRSQIDDDVSPGRYAHVHLEVQPVDAPRLVDAVG